MSPVRFLAVLVIALVPLLATAEERAPVPEATACNADNDSCREGCTLEFGTSFTTRKKLAVCLEACRSKHKLCTERWADVHRHGLAPGALDDRAAEGAPPQVTPPEPELPPEPKRDLSDWDPEGD